MIEHLRTYNGYCGQCGQPGTVGEYRLRGWASVFAVCADCLTKLIERQKGSANVDTK
jgi:hypothetical protein